MEDHIDDQKRFLFEKKTELYDQILIPCVFLYDEQWFLVSSRTMALDHRSSQAATLLIHPETRNVNVRCFSIA